MRMSMCMLMCRLRDRDENCASAIADHSCISRSASQRSKKGRRQRGGVGTYALRRCILTKKNRLVAELAAQLRKEVRKAQSSLRSSLAEANAMLEELRAQRERRRSAESV